MVDKLNLSEKDPQEINYYPKVIGSRKDNDLSKSEHF